MEGIKLFLFNSLSTTFGLILFTIFLYIIYKCYSYFDNEEISFNEITEVQVNSLMDELESIVDEDEIKEEL